MLTHAQIWGAIDRLAARHGFSASGLARSAGLDPTSFNRSKRVTPEGRPRWPSTESIAKILQATGSSIDEFIALLSQKKNKRPAKPLPVISLAEAGSGGHFDKRGFPSGSNWGKAPFPHIDDEHAYALEISTHSLAPLYRKGDLVVVSPKASVRKGDRVMVKTKSGEAFAAELKRRTPKSVDFVLLTPGHRDQTFSSADILWIARIVWSSQ
ncbi:MAG TPA: helix-turn-helix transcriptional regulator [Xanthobacteraceae bacterium]|nr:helix-turn-helix transcriptional regulator [Xanthobacteraceae bacterium]